MFCVILAAAYAGLAKFCWEPLEKSRQWDIFINIEGFFITIALLSLLLGLRPYLSPCSLQISRFGIKYRGPYWPQRKSVNWNQIFKLYVSPELIIVLYRLPNKPKSIRPLLVQSVYLSEKEKIADSVAKYCPLEPVYLGSPGLVTRVVQYGLFAAIVFWIIKMLLT